MVYSDILQKTGGTYIPDYGHKQHISYDEEEKVGWNELLKYLNNQKADERINTTIKNRKIETEILNHLLHSKNKKLIINNPNIMKLFIVSMSVFYPFLEVNMRMCR